jgi:hypothetical protein
MYSTFEGSALSTYLPEFPNEGTRLMTSSTSNSEGHSGCNKHEERGWSHIEARIALISVVISAMGVIFSAASTYFTWNQVRQTFDERMTPYKAVIFDKKVDAYSELMSSSSDLRGATLAIVVLMMENKLDSSIKINEVFSTLKPKINAYFTAYERAKLLMPRDVSDKFNKFDIIQANQLNCINEIANRNVANLICDEDVFAKFPQAGAKNLEVAFSAMREDIQADRLQLERAIKD